MHVKPQPVNTLHVALLTDPCMPGRAASTSAGLVTKRALLRSRLPEPAPPSPSKAKEMGMREPLTEAFRVELTRLEAWTHYPDEHGNPANLSDLIKRHVMRADNLKSRCAFV